MPQKILILGASNKPDRYSNKAQVLLTKLGHQLILVNRGLTESNGLPVVSDLSSVKEPVDVLTIYVRPDLSSQLSDDILELKPRHVIFNPGTENPALATRLTEAEIPWQNACTLVLYRTGQAPVVHPAEAVAADSTPSSAD
jgi:predicted CoA-binding protein